MTDHPKAVREARDALVAAIGAARAAGYRVDGGGDLAGIHASETAKVIAAREKTDKVASTLKAPAIPKA